MSNFNIPGKLVLAPMAGVTDRAFRELCKEYGADYCVSEMVSAKAVQLNNRKSYELAYLSAKEMPAAIQIFGDDPYVMAFAADKMMEFHPYAIDINMGCPAPKIASGGGGVSLMQTPSLCGEIVSAVVKAVPVPVTVKIRSGLTEKTVNAIEVAKICEQAGASAIAVHGRTRDQMYSGLSDHAIIKKVRESVSVPVIGNGDVKDAESAEKLLLDTDCPMIMIGRGAMGNPWVFSEIKAHLSGGDYNKPSVAERMKVMSSHVEQICLYKGEKIGMKEARKHIGWYLYGMHGAAAFRRRAMTLSNLSELSPLIEDIILESEKNDEN